MVDENDQSEPLEPRPPTRADLIRLCSALNDYGAARSLRMCRVALILHEDALTRARSRMKSFSFLAVNELFGLRYLPFSQICRVHFTNFSLEYVNIVNK